MQKHCQITKLKQFSNEFDVLHSRENNQWVRGLYCLTNKGALPDGLWARASFTECLLAVAMQKWHD